MDQLDLLKKDWKKQDSSLPKLSFDELSKLIHKKSSSIVKWILIISILEITLPHLVYLFVDFEKSMKLYQDVGLSTFLTIFYIIAYIVIAYFVYRFYKNYRSISADSTTKGLIQNIIKTRKTVKHYIWFNLALVPVVGGIVLYATFNSQEFLNQLPENVSSTTLFVTAVVVILLTLVVFWLFYQTWYMAFYLNKLKKKL